MAERGVDLSDVRRARVSRDRAFVPLATALASPPDGPIDEESLRLMRALAPRRFDNRSPEQQRTERALLWEQLERRQGAPERLALWREVDALRGPDAGAFERDALVGFALRGPIRWGSWRAIKGSFKRAESESDWELYGAAAARFDLALAGVLGHDPSEVSRATIAYMARRAWRGLRRLGRALPAAFPGAAAEVLRHYPDATLWGRTWTAYRAMASAEGSGPLAAAWRRSPRPLLGLMERAQAEHVRQFAARVLKREFAAALRDIEPAWIARLTERPSCANHDFVVWVMEKNPTFELSNLRALGLHDAILRLLESPSRPARAFGLSYARAYATDVGLEVALRLADHNDQEVRGWAADVLLAREKRGEVGLKAWTELLGRPRAKGIAERVLSKKVGGGELTAAWFGSLLASGHRGLEEFAAKYFKKAHDTGALEPSFWLEILRAERTSRAGAIWVAARMAERSSVANEVSAQFWREALLRPDTRQKVIEFIAQGELDPRALGLEFWRSIATRRGWDADASIGAIVSLDSRLVWARGLAWDEELAAFARDFVLADVRLVEPAALGLDWLLDLFVDGSQHERAWAKRVLLDAFAPADFASAQRGGESGDKGEPVDLGGASFVFTGKLATMTRSEANAKVKAAGGAPAKSVTKELDYLVVGDEGSPLFDGGKKGSKILKAEALAAAGQGPRVISETAFLKMLTSGAPKADEGASEAGAEVLWAMLANPDTGQRTKALRTLAVAYVRAHHAELGEALAGRAPDPGAEMPAGFLSWERGRALLADDRAALRKLGIELARYELARWAPPIAGVRALCEAPHPEVKELFERALLARTGEGFEAWHIEPGADDVDEVYRMCDSLDRRTRRLGAALVERYPERLFDAERLFALTQSLDRQVMSFALAALWRHFRARGVTRGWDPVPVEQQAEGRPLNAGPKGKRPETGPGVGPAPGAPPAGHAELASLLRRSLFALPPSRPAGVRGAKQAHDAAALEGARDRENQNAPDRGASERGAPRAALVSGWRAKRAWIEVTRDLAVADEAFAALALPLWREMMPSRGETEREACLVAIVRVEAAHPRLAVQGQESGGSK